MRIFCITAGILLLADLLHSETIHFKTAQDAEAARTALRAYIWGEAGPPSKRIPDSISINIQDSFYTSLYSNAGNLAQIDRYVVDLGLGLESYVYHFHARQPNGKLFVYHSGHSPGGYKGEDANINNNTAPGIVIPTMLRNGYDVLAFAMPLYGNTNPSIELPSGKIEQFIYHGQIFAYLSHPYTYFFDPIWICLNYIEDHFSYRSISMTGLSGGGWTTTLYQAIDPRIKEGFEVAGSLPLDLRTGYEGFGDSEQGFDYNGLYGVTNYEEIYCLAAFGPGRRHIQIHNRYDDQTFWGQRYVLWIDSVTSAVGSIGSGEYRFYSDEIARRHTISPFALNIILDTMATGLPDAPMQFSPADGAKNLNKYVYFDWSQANRADHFEFQLSADSAFSSAMICDSVLVGYRSEDSVSMTRNDTVYWRVAAINAAGRSSWSAVRRVVLPNTPPVVTSRGDSSIVEETKYVYQPAAVDADSATFNDSVTYSMIELPSWLSYDAGTHCISGMPPVGAHDTLLTLEAFDQRGGHSVQTTAIHVVHVNHTPDIISTGSFTAREDSLYRYALAATDPDTIVGDMLSYSLTKHPFWLSVDSRGVVSGIPGGGSVGDTIVTVCVTDGKGGTASQSYLLTVQHTNHAPVFGGMPAGAVAIEDVLFRCQVYAHDQDSLRFGDLVHYHLAPGGASSWLSVDSTTGWVQGTPRITTLQDTAVTVIASDGSGAHSAQSFSVHISHVNHGPEILSLPGVSAREDSLYRYRVQASDPDTLIGDMLSYSVTKGPAWLVVDSRTGTISGVPKAMNVGDSLVAIRVSDNNGGTADQTFMLTVSHTNHAPRFVTTAMDEAIEDVTYQGAIRTTDQDSALFGDRVHYRLANRPAWVTGIDSVTGVITGTPRLVNMTDTAVTVTAYDNAGGSVSQAFFVHIRHVNHPPAIAAAASKLTAKEDSTFIYQASAVDIDTLVGDVLHYRLVVKPAWMTIDSLRGIVAGIPAARQVGDTTFTVQAVDASGSAAVQAFPLTVLHTNHPPQISSMPSASALEDSSYSSVVHAIDIDSVLFGDRVRYRFLIQPVWMTIDSITGALSGTPRLTQLNDTSVTIQAYDNEGGTVSYHYSVRIQHVNHAPQLAGIAQLQANEDSTFVYRVNGVDIDTLIGDRLRYHLISKPAWIQIDSVNGTMTGLPGASNVGDTSCTITVSDLNGVTVSQSVPIKVLHTNHSPSIIASALPEAVEDSLYRASVSAIDVDITSFGDRVSYAMTGPLWLSIDSQTGTITGTPVGNNARDTVLSIKAIDRAGAFDLKMMPLTVRHRNHNPVVTSQPPLTATEDTLYNYRVIATDQDSIFGDRLQVVARAMPSWLKCDSLKGTVWGTPGPSNVGDTTVTIAIEDGSGGTTLQQFALHVSHVNHPPQIDVVPRATAVEDTPYRSAVHAADADSAIFGDRVHYRLSVGSSAAWLSIDSTTGIVAGTPRVNDLNDTIAVLEAYDDNGSVASRPFNFHITHVNHTPEITTMGSFRASEDSLYRYALGAIDPDTLVGDHLTYGLVKHPVWLTVDAQGVVSGIPSGASVGDTLLTVIVNDGHGGTASQSYQITVQHTNHAPIFVSPVPGTTVVEDVLYRYHVSAFDQDSARFGDRVHYRLSAAGSGGAWLSIDSTTGWMEGTPRLATLSDTSVTVIATDLSGASTVQNFNLHIQHVNHTPEIASLPPILAAKEDSLYIYRVQALDSDTLIGDVLAYSLTRAPSWLAIDSRTGEISGVPHGGNVGRDSVVSVRVNDGHGGTADQNFSLTVLHTNHAPQFNFWTAAPAQEDSLYTTRITAHDQDSARFGDRVSYQLAAHPAWIAGIDSATGIVWGTPHQADLRDTIFSVRATDNAGGSVTMPFTIPIRHTNHAPVFANKPDTLLYEDSMYVYHAVLSDPDVKMFNDVLSDSMLAAPKCLSLNSVDTVLSGTASFEFFEENKDRIQHGAIGIYADTVVEIEGRDDKGATIRQQFTLHVIHRNHAPLIVSRPDSAAVEDSLYAYHPELFDIDQHAFNDSLRFSFVTKPSWISYDTLHRSITGMPSGINARDTVVTFEITDGVGGATRQTYVLRVKQVNHAPVITSTPQPNAFEDSVYTYKIQVTDPDMMYKGDSVTARMISGPAWLTVNESTMMLTGKPEWKDLRDTAFVLEVRDKGNATALQQCRLKVNAVAYAPEAAEMVFPQNRDTLLVKSQAYSIKFAWKRATDRNLGDTLLYRLHCWANKYDTLSAWMNDSAMTITWNNAISIEGDLRYTVEVTDGKHQVGINDTLLVVVKNAGTGIKEWNSMIPTEYIVYQNYPNPFNPSTTIRFGLPERAKVSVDIYNSIGQLVESVYRGIVLDPMYYEVSWNASGKATGMYIALISAESLSSPSRIFRDVKKLLLIK